MMYLEVTSSRSKAWHLEQNVTGIGRIELKYTKINLTSHYETAGFTF